MQKRTWVWVVLGIVALLMVGCFAVVGTGVYLVSRQTDFVRTDATGAEREFDEIRQRFAGQSPLIVMEPGGEVSTRELQRRATSYSGPLPTQVHLVAWDGGEGRLVRIAVPFWMLKLGGRGSLRINEFNFDRLDVGPDDLEQAGPALVLDHTDGADRVLIYTD
jgi:hypothetical protein